HNPRQFDLISKVASGALVSEIVLNLRNPPKIGQKVASGCVIYLDSPFIIDLLDLADKRQHIYASDLVKDLKDSGAYLRTFEHNLSEIRAIMSATIEGSNSVNSAVGTVAYRARTDANARSRLQAIRANLEKKVREVGVTTVDLDTATKDTYKYFPD